MIKKLLLAAVVACAAFSEARATTTIIYGGGPLYGGWGYVSAYAPLTRGQSRLYYGGHRARFYRQPARVRRLRGF